MKLTLITKPTIEPVTTAEMMEHLNLTHSQDDAFVRNLVTAARRWLERDMNRAFITQTWELARDDFPGSGSPIELPRSPLQSITSVTYTDTNGDSQTWASSNYVADTRRKPGSVSEAFGVVWPAVRDIVNAVVVRFVCGDGDAASDVGEEAKTLIRGMAANLYENREATVEKTLAVVPMGYQDLKRSERVFRFV